MTTSAFEPLKRDNLSRQIADQLRRAIVDGELRADDRLPTEDELALRFGVSRPTIREALKILAAQNLIRSKRGPTGGTFINCPSIPELSESLTCATTLLVGMDAFNMDEVLQARELLESQCCRLAALNRTPEQLQRMRQQLEIQQDSSLSAEDFCASDVALHRTLADASGNRLLGFVMFSVIEALQPVTNMVAHRFRDRALVSSQHLRLIEALENRDADAACAIVCEQLSDLRQHLGSAPPTPAQQGA
ncbi:FadR/GntR family transcriptional regulator [Marinobacterium rhizophilum]|uniref:FadR family transcriptional regulator n=1 Tax=Marinobacterium rhizophilum TaxID=420402 RepID=A0ABY5HSP6_9GAMM|nr:FadR/GntR family transcriptional regulator [Marinobacterium rhizophilum]UTW13986.1 FadR family transcriptional regulator [Marinobacterium rhizophilum]